MELGTANHRHCEPVLKLAWQSVHLLAQEEKAVQYEMPQATTLCIWQSVFARLTRALGTEGYARI